jgi:glycerol-3-phosphate dehydrogenase (NAD(P)+)
VSVAVIGGGAFGVAMAAVLGAKGPVTLWARGPLRRLGMVLPPSVTVTHDLSALEARTVLLAIPAQELGGFLAAQAGRFAGHRLVACCKGVDVASGLGPAGLIRAACPDAVPALLTGPSFAADIAAGLPTALTLACADDATGADLQGDLSTPALRLYRTTDVTGAELGGALKNVVAIAAGAATGAGLGDSARAALVTRGYAEMVRLAVACGARAETLAGLSGLGDLILTCTSDKSRNFRFGIALGRGQPFEPDVTVEGVATARALAARHGDGLPVTAAVAGLVDGRLRVGDAMAALMARPLKAE